MTFKTQKIRSNINNSNNDTDSKNPDNQPKSHKKIKIQIPIFISIAIIVLLLVGIVKAVSHINFTVFLKVAGEELQKDAYGHTNFLILGTGGVKHEGADLTDTIILASIDDENNLVTIMSIPRDFYIEDNEIGNSRINEVYYNAKQYYEDDEKKALEYVKLKIEELTGLQIQYVTKINFQGFKDLVDAIGGIDLYVEEAIYDPYYPKDGTFLYETFSISKGVHHMDGETALKYARSRKTTSDFDRADRQQEIIYAIKEKALKTEVILDKEKLINLLNALKANIETNIQVKKMLTLGAMAKDYSQDSITQRLIHDDPTQCGGLVYPPIPEYYNNMFVLISAGGEKTIKQYIDLTFNYPQIAKENASIYILNGTKEYGVAGETKQVLKRLCLEVSEFGNSPSQDKTQTIYYYKQKYDEKGNQIDSKPKVLEFLQKYIPGKESMVIPEEYNTYFFEADLLIELGSDYVDSKNYLIDDFYYIDSSIYSTNPAINTNGKPNTTDTSEITDSSIPNGNTPE